MNRLPFAERANYTTNPSAKKLFQIIATKQTNLALSADVNTAQELLTIIEQVGEHICLLKTHIDIINDYSPSFSQKLQHYAEKYQFLLFEDRKFADIGNTVKQQYRDGIYRTSDWADIVNAHILPGEGIIEGLKAVGLPKDRGLLLIAEMSSANNFITPDYVQANIALAKKHRDFVIGFICQRQLVDDPSFFHMTPGVQLTAGEDALGQRYLTPESVIRQGRSDVIIVGRGIVAADDPVTTAKLYRSRAWQAYDCN